MPPIEKHLQVSLASKGADFRTVHEWLDGDAAKKVERHDITRIFEFGTMFEQQYGKEAREEYLRHLNDDLKAKFDHLQHDLAKQIADTLAYFGVK